MNSVINVKTEPKIKLRAQKMAGDLGLTLSGVINAYLRQFVRTKTLFVSAEYREPSELVIAALRDAEVDWKNKKARIFNKPEQAIKFLDKIIAKK